MAADGPICVIDDDEALRDSVEFLLRTGGYRVQTYISAQSFLGDLPNLHSGCVLSDIRMPGMTGIELLDRLKALKFALPVILMTGQGDVALAVDAMKRGAADFIEKPFDDLRLLSAVRAAIETPGAADPPADAEALQIAARVASLSAREKQVLESLVEGRTNKEIGREYSISPRTVEVYRANVMHKMRASTLSELVKLALRAGPASH
jgi:two-component system, LuxR family, response regulator FixJ